MQNGANQGTEPRFSKVLVTSRNGPWVCISPSYLRYGMYIQGKKLPQYDQDD